MRDSLVLDPQELLAHGRSLRALARSLVGDAADDVVQEAWVVALERPPARRDGLGGWLHGVVRSVASNRRRHDGRRAHRERGAARDEAVGSAAEAVERSALVRDVVRAVCELDEPYRSTIHLRFFEDLPPREIAARTGTPLATVKSRLHRGLDELRGRLDARDPGGRAEWLPALAVFAGAGGGGTRFARTGELAGAIAMAGTAKVLVGSLGAAAVGFSLWWFGGARDGYPIAPAISSLTAEERADAELVGTVRGPDEPAAPERASRAEVGSSAPVEVPVDLGLAPALAAGTLHPYTLEVTALDPWDRPVEGADVFAGPLGHPLNHAGKTDAEGELRLEWLGRSGSMEIAYLVRPDPSRSSALTSTRIGAGAPHRVHADLPEVADDTWGAAAEATLANVVRLRGEPGDPLRFQEDDLQDADVFEGVQMIRFRTELDALTYTMNPGIELEIQALMAAELSRLQAERAIRGVSVEGVVFDEAGAPVASCLVGARPEGRDWEWTTTDDEGRYELRDLRSNAAELRAGGRHLGLAVGHASGAEGSTRTWSPVLDRGREVAGVVTGTDGTAQSGLWVQIVDDDPVHPWSDTASTDARGRFTLPNTPAGSYRLLVFDRDGLRGAPIATVDGVFAGSTDLEVRLGLADYERGSVEVALTDEAGTPTRQATVRLWHLNTDRGIWLERVEAEAGAHWAASQLPPGAYRVEAGSSGFGWHDLGVVHVAAGSTSRVGPFVLGAPAKIDFQLPRWASDAIDEWTMVRLRDDAFTLVWGSHAHAARLYEIEAQLIRLHTTIGGSEIERVPGQVQAAEPEVAHRPATVPAGRYRVILSGDGLGTIQFDVEVSAGQRAEVEVPLAFAQPAVVLLHRTEGEESARLVVRDVATGLPVYDREIGFEDDGRQRVELYLVPGEYEVEATLAGATETAPLEIDDAPPRALGFTLP